MIETAPLETSLPIVQEYTSKDGTSFRGGAALRWAREKSKCTQPELARELRVSQADLSKMETGKRPIGKRLARKFAHHFKLDYRIFL